jgi:hypothetical protein
MTWGQHCDYCDEMIRGRDRQDCVTKRLAHESECKKMQERLQAEADRQAYLKRTGRRSMLP